MFKKRNRNNISKIIENNLDYLVRFAYFRLGERSEAEDVVYDAILKFLERNPNEIKPESIRLYLFRIVHNLCLDRLRYGKRELSLDDNINIEESPDDLYDLEEIERINDFLISLPQRESDVIRMRIVDNLSFVEISKILSIPQSTSKSRYKSGMEKLRRLVIKNKL